MKVHSKINSATMINSERRENGKKGQRPLLIQLRVFWLSVASLIHFLENQEGLFVWIRKMWIILRTRAENSKKAINGLHGSPFGLATKKKQFGFNSRKIVKFKIGNSAKDCLGISQRTALRRLWRRC